MLLFEWAPQPAVWRRLAESLQINKIISPKEIIMSGHPTVFDFATIIPTENGAPLVHAAPYGIIEVGDNLRLRSYFHCGGVDAVVRKNISTILTTGVVTVQYFFQDLQNVPPISVTPRPGGVFSQLTVAQIDLAFRTPNDLAGSKLDPTDDYYLSDDTVNIPTAGPGNLVPGATTGTWRILTVLHGVLGAERVTAFDDNLVIQVIV
jgi:hypothetical protein